MKEETITKLLTTLCIIIISMIAHINTFQHSLKTPQGYLYTSAKQRCIGTSFVDSFLLEGGMDYCF